MGELVVAKSSGIGLESARSMLAVWLVLGGLALLAALVPVLPKAAGQAMVTSVGRVAARAS